jgi:hypothetical protein
MPWMGRLTQMKWSEFCLQHKWERVQYLTTLMLHLHTEVRYLKEVTEVVIVGVVVAIVVVVVAAAGVVLQARQCLVL